MRTRTSGQGRPKGTPNKLTTDVKAMILGALDKAGGEKYLLTQAKANPGAFMVLLGKILPTQVSGVSGGAPIGMSISLRRAEALKAIAESFAEVAALGSNE